MTLRSYVPRNSYTVLAVAVALLAGVIIGCTVPSRVGQSLYRLLMFCLGGFILVGLAVSRAPRQLLIAFFVIVVPLNLAFSPLSDSMWHPGRAPSSDLVFVNWWILIAFFLVPYRIMATVEAEKSLTLVEVEH